MLKYVSLLLPYIISMAPKEILLRIFKLFYFEFSRMYMKSVFD